MTTAHRTLPRSHGVRPPPTTAAESVCRYAHSKHTGGLSASCAHTWRTEGRMRRARAGLLYLGSGSPKALQLWFGASYTDQMRHAHTASARFPVSDSACEGPGLEGMQVCSGHPHRCGILLKAALDAVGACILCVWTAWWMGCPRWVLKFHCQSPHLASIFKLAARRRCARTRNR